MTTARHPTVPSQTTVEGNLRLVWLVLLGLNIVMLAISLPPLIRGEKDMYLYEHARSVTSAVFGVSLCSSFLARSMIIKCGLLGAAAVSTGVTVWLHMP